jgi:hypothetical protein
MSELRTIAKKLKAWESGRPLPRYDTIHRAVMPADQCLLVAFVRMAGESRPWGIAWGTLGTDAVIRSVPDGRVRDDVSELVAEFAEDLLAHLRVHNWTFDPVPQKPFANELRQVWLPNAQHIAMLHQLNYTYSQTKYGGTNQDILRAVGRLAGWMFRDSSRTGNQHVVNASGLLDDSYVFPAQSARTAHLGFQLAWLSNEGNREEHAAAAAQAERLTVSPTMDPSLERDYLSVLVDGWQASRREGTDNSDQATSIATALDSELRRRWILTQQAYHVIEGDQRSVNSGVGGLIQRAHKEFWSQHQRIELRLSDPSQGPAYIAHPETDHHGSAAASRYLEYAAADEAYFGQMVHADDALFAEALADGRAFDALVVNVSDAGTGRTTTPRWVLRVDPSLPNRIRESGRLRPRGSSGHEVTIIDVDAHDDDLFITVEWTARKTKALTGPAAARPADPIWEGATVAFVQSDAAGITQLRSQRVWAARNGPGAWLTHGKASVPIEITDDDGTSDLLVDDVAQIEDGETP